MRMERTSGDALFHLRAQSRVNYSRLLGTTSSQSWSSPKTETLQPPWATCSRIWPLSQLKKKSFSKFKWNFSLCLLPIVLSLGTHEKSLTLIFIPWVIYTHWQDPPLNPLFARMNSPSSLSLSQASLQSPSHLRGRSLHSSRSVPFLHSGLQMWPYQGWREGSPPSICWQCSH